MKRKTAIGIGVAAAAAFAGVALSGRSGGGSASPFTGLFDGLDEPPQPEPGSGYPGTGPQGKGVFLRSYKHAKTPDHFVSRLREMGMGFVFLPITWQKANGNHNWYTKREAEFVPALQAAGIEIWVWGWPEPGFVTDFVEAMQDAADRTGAVGIVVNAEKPFYGEPDAARFLAQGLASDRWALSSYGGGPRNHPGFPWEAFLDAGPVIGMPQLYANPDKYGEDFYRRGVDDWTQAGYSAISPTLGASNARGPDVMEQIAYLTAKTGVRGLSWWDFYWLELSSKRRQAVANVRVPLGGPAVA